MVEMAEADVRAVSGETKGVARPQSLSHPAQPLKDIPLNDVEERLRTGMGELDRVLGGGIVPGSLVLIGGDPGIGKSTLLLQMAALLSSGDVPVLYATGEESLSQLKMRARRLKVPGASLHAAAETALENALSQATQLKAKALIIDSIQTMYRSDLSGSPGSPSQLRECTLSLMSYAKSSGCAVFLVGHVTKEGVLAGPRMLEHMVDTVIYFEGDRHLSYRVLRAVKNRFGATHEIGVFEMTGLGLREVSNPSELFLSERDLGSPGTAVFAGIEGTRPVLVELQALVAPSTLGLGSTPTKTATVYAQVQTANQTDIDSTPGDNSGKPGSVVADQDDSDLLTLTSPVSATDDVELTMVALDAAGNPLDLTRYLPAGTEIQKGQLLPVTTVLPDKFPAVAPDDPAGHCP